LDNDSKSGKNEIAIISGIFLHDGGKVSFDNKNIKSKQKPYYITAQEVLKENNYIPDNIYSHSECPTPP
jgi:hypothetical protein